MKKGNKRFQVAFMPTHPAQLWLLKPVVEEVAHFADVIWILREKDVMLKVARELKIEYLCLSRAGSGLLGNAWELFLNIFRCMALARRYAIDLWVTQYAAGNLAARLTGNRSLCYNDDDFDAVPIACALAYLPASVIYAPAVTRVGPFGYKTKRYAGTHELFYLHPKRFKPDPGIFSELGLAPNEPYLLVRLVSLSAHHDKGAKGISDHLLNRLIQVASGCCRVLVSSETPLQAPFNPYRLNTAPGRIHHVLAYARAFVGDSQTMAAEAAVLGTPSLRYSSFVGRLAYLDMLEDYGLTFGFRPGDEESLLRHLGKIIHSSSAGQEYEELKIRMLESLGDPLPSFIREIKCLLNASTGDPV